MADFPSEAARTLGFFLLAELSLQMLATSTGVELEHDNHELRDALARALGERRTSAILGTASHLDTPGRQDSKLIGRC